MCQTITWAQQTISLLSEWQKSSYLTLDEKVKHLRCTPHEWKQVGITENESKRPHFQIQYSPSLWKPCKQPWTWFNYIKEALNFSHIVASPSSALFLYMLWCSFMRLQLSSTGPNSTTVNGSLAGSVFSFINHSSSPDISGAVGALPHTLQQCQHHYPHKQWPPCSLTAGYWSWLNFQMSFNRSVTLLRCICQQLEGGKRIRGHPPGVSHGLLNSSAG